MIPTTESFCSHNHPCLIIHLWLIPDLNLPILDSQWKLAYDVCGSFPFLPLIRVIKLIPILSSVFNSLLSNPGQVQHMINVWPQIILRCQDVNATTYPDTPFFSPVNEEIPHRINYFLIIEADLFISSCPAQHGKTVSYDTSHSFLLRKGLLRFLRPKPKQLITGFFPHAVIDVFEILYVSIGK